MCISPQFVPAWKKVHLPVGQARRKHLDPNSKGLGGWHNAKDFDNLVERACGKCPDCRRIRAIQWCFRLNEEQKVSFTGQFLTLTYANEHLPEKNLLKKDDLKQFWKKVRRQVDYLYDGDDPDFNKYGKNSWLMEEQYHRMKEAHWFKEKRTKYYQVGEYGTQNGRPHYHAIVFNLPKPIIRKINKIWGKGHVKVGNVTPQSIRYVANYVMQVDYEKDITKREFSSTSNGMGAEYGEKNTSYHRRRISSTVQYNGGEIPMPRYYRNKFFTQEERDHLAELNKARFDEQEHKLLAELRERGIDIKQYKAMKADLAWQQFNNHKKRRKV